MDVIGMTKTLLETVPQELIPTANEGLLIRKHSSLFKHYEDDLIAGFYNLIYTDPATKSYLSSDARLAREATLRQWYNVTITGDFNDHYWAWQALVGIVHVKHHIPNGAFLSMWSWMISFLQTRLLNDLPNAEASALIAVLQKLQATVCSIIVESFILTQQEAIKRSSGLNKNLLERFIQIEIDELLKQSRALLKTEALMVQLPSLDKVAADNIISLPVQSAIPQYNMAVK